MQKSLYSLILFDDVVDKIDQLAYERNMNRSYLINEILAEKVGLMTPEKMIKKVVDKLTDKMKEHTSIKVTSKSDYGNIQFGTYLKYKYKPSIRYSFEFVGNNDDRYAILKVSSRTKSEELEYHLSCFFSALCDIDQMRFPQIHARQIVSQRITNSNNKFSREFFRGIALNHIEEDVIVEYLSCYLSMLDHAISYYFNHYNDEDVFVQIDKIYCHYLRNLKLTIGQ